MTQVTQKYGHKKWRERRNLHFCQLTAFIPSPPTQQLIKDAEMYEGIRERERVQRERARERDRGRKEERERERDREEERERGKVQEKQKQRENAFFYHTLLMFIILIYQNMENKTILVGVLYCRVPLFIPWEDSSTLPPPLP